MNHEPKAGLQVVPWPSEDRRRSAWWILDYTPGRGFRPVHGPYAKRAAADARLAEIEGTAPKDPPVTWPYVHDGRTLQCLAMFPDTGAGTALANRCMAENPDAAVLCCKAGRIVLASRLDKGTP